MIAIDVLGFGGSHAGPNAAFTLDEHVAALHRTVRTLRLRRRFTLVGHSLGALISSRYAAVHRREVAHLVLVAPPVYAHHRYIDELGHRMRVGGYLWFYRFVRDNRLTIVGNAGLLSRFMPSVATAVDDRAWVAFAKTMENCIETQSTATDIAQVSVPIDIVWGSRDQVIVPDALRQLGGMHHVQLHEVPRTDHFIRPPLAREVARLIR